jgi:cell division protein FtsN
MNLEKTVNIIAIVLLLALGAVALIVMQKTTESSTLATHEATRQSRKNSKVLKQVRELTSEIKVLRQDMKKIKKAVESADNKKKEKRR